MKRRRKYTGFTKYSEITARPEVVKVFTITSFLHPRRKLKGIMVLGRQGALFQVVLSQKWLSLWLFGLIPVAGVRLVKIRTLRSSNHREFWEGGLERWGKCWRYWSWPGSPGPPRQVFQGHYLIETVKGTHIWVRLRSGMHYKLREATHRQQMTGVKAKDPVPARRDVYGVRS